uniref:Uncharacterized protein n=1 Tax=Pararge aegeria TaxID=116150 RepID=S4PNR8_9NEOP
MPHVQVLDVEDVVGYVKLYNLITPRCIKFMRKAQIFDIVNKCCEKIHKTESAKFVRQALLSNKCGMLNSKTLRKEIFTNEDRLCMELKNLVLTYTGNNA